MKNLKVFTFSILLVGMHLTSCKKDADQQLQPGTPAGNKEKLFEKSLTIYNADKSNSTTLRFRAASKVQLDKMALENIEFTLVEIPVSATEATGMAASTLPGDEGSSVFSNKDASQSQSTNEKLVLPEDGIQVDLPFEPKTKSISIQVKSKDLNNRAAALALASNCTPVSIDYHWIQGYNKIKVTNQDDCQITVSFSHKNIWGNWVSATGGLRLNQNGWASYCNPLWTVRVKVEHPTYGSSYVVTYYPSC